MYRTHVPHPRAPPRPAQASNLALAAGMTQRWYRRTFRTYPRARRALVPLIY